MKSIRPQLTQVQVKTILEPQIKKGDILTISGYENDNFTVKATKEIYTNPNGFILEVERKKETIEDLMNSLIKANDESSIEDTQCLIIEESQKNDKNITFEITLTKRQKELFDKKGGVFWLKKALVGQASRRKSK